MRRRGCGADQCPVTAQVCVTSMPGISEVPHRSTAVSSVAGLAWQVPRRACRLWSVPAAGRAPGRRRTGPGPRLWQAGAAVTCPAGARDGRVTMGALDVAGLSWTSWDMIQNVRRADQAHCEATDATRTERGFHAARNGESAGQRASDGQGWAPCKTVGFAFPGSNPGPATTSENVPWPADSAIFQTVGSGAVLSRWVQRSSGRRGQQARRGRWRARTVSPGRIPARAAC